MQNPTPAAPNNAPATISTDAPRTNPNAHAVIPPNVLKTAGSIACSCLLFIAATSVTPLMLASTAIIGNTMKMGMNTTTMVITVAAPQRN